MLRNTAEMPPECRECFGIEELIVEVAQLQDKFLEETQLGSAEQAAFDPYVKHTEARQTSAGQQYTKVENRLLDVLEIATFCSGQKNKCFKAKIANTTPINKNPIVTQYEAPKLPSHSSVVGYRWLTGLF